MKKNDHMIPVCRFFCEQKVFKNSYDCRNITT